MDESYDGSIDQIAHQLMQKAALRRTGQRIRLLTFLLRHRRPLSHREMTEHTDLREMDRVTIYRILSVLENAGLLHAVHGPDGILRYSINPFTPNGCPGGHPHFLCTACGRMACLTDQKIPWIDLPEGNVARGKELIVYGTCAECAPSSS